MLESVAERAPHAEALIDTGGSLSFSQLLDRVRSTASAIETRIDPGATVAVIGANHRTWVELYYGAPAAGRTLVFLNHRLHAVELRSMLRRSRAAVVIGDERELDRLRSVDVHLPMFSWSKWGSLVEAPPDRWRPVAADPMRPAWLLFTSGTTAEPKGALLAEDNILAAVDSSSMARPVEPDDRYAFVFPLCHIAGYNVVHRHSSGRPVILLSGFDAVEFCDVVEREHVTSTSLAATMLATLVDLLDAEPGRRQQLGSLRSIAYGAAPMPTPLLRRADALLGVEFAQGYGMTELSGNAVFLDAAAHRRGLDEDAHLLEAAGRPAPGVELRLVDHDGNDVQDGSIGEILVRAPQVMLGYLDDPDATQATLRDGWLHTGDMGRREAGLLSVVDRKKDIVITGGENVSSLEVESAVLDHPDVARVAVVGLPDPTWGENVCAVIVPSVGADIDPLDVVASVRATLAGYKVPRHVVIVDELPQTASGKVIKAELRQWLAMNPEIAGPRL